MSGEEERVEGWLERVLVMVQPFGILDSTGSVTGCAETEFGLECRRWTVDKLRGACGMRLICGPERATLHRIAARGQNANTTFPSGFYAHSALDAADKSRIIRLNTSRAL
jgi:hypothetical protein